MLIRAFIAVVPPDEILDSMEKFLSHLRPLADHKWVNRQQLHLTLRFLGEISPEMFDGIKIELDDVRMPPFLISLDNSGAFPNFSRAKVLWISGEPGSEELAQLAAQTEQIAVSCGLTPEKRKFSPHLTIARTRAEGKISENFIRAMKDTPVFSWRCSDFVLMQSQLTPRGPIYTPAKKYQLEK
ncbi:MAG: RNA 2',3'-cyclic phosphodiesterase [Synergistaceae bacterium]|nr:RNA 2',3'-cyclic phosphodiesterase [Synergistaceae bacterium]